MTHMLTVTFVSMIKGLADKKTKNTSTCLHMLVFMFPAW